jgi:short subunit dehydrogenase-like uncharacterized protein
MIDACFASRTHYVDITGEFDVFVAAQAGGCASRRNSPDLAIGDGASRSS